jgi:hypothetical protein
MMRSTLPFFGGCKRKGPLMESSLPRLSAGVPCVSHRSVTTTLPVPRLNTCGEGPSIMKIDLPSALFMGPSVALSSVKVGKLKMLAFGSEKRIAQFPDVPTIAETVPGYEASVSFGLFAAAGTPADIIEKINADVQKTVSDPEFQKNYLERFAVQPVPGSLDAFAEYLRKDSAQLGHADTRMTERHYAHLAPNYVADTIRANFPRLTSSDTRVVPIRHVRKTQSSRA